MLYRRELCNLQNPDEAKLLVEIAAKSLQNSEWILTGGYSSRHFFDLDNSLCEKEKAKALSQLLADKIQELSKTCTFNKVAFIDKGESGPVGLISIMGLIASLIDIETILVRPKKLLLRSVVKGELKMGDRVLILSDVATTGFTIFETAQKILARGANAPYALVVFDRLQGATENLGRKGIELYSLSSAKSLREEKGQEIQERYGLSITPDFEPNLKDFGGKCVTMLR